MAKRCASRKHRRMSKALRIASVLLFITGANGCTVMPTGLHGRTYIDKDSLAHIQTGETSKEEVQQALGPPDWSFNHGSRWIYMKRRRGDYSLSGCVLVPDGDDSWKCSKSKTVPTMEFVDFSFDSDGVIATQDSYSIKSGTCSESNVCFQWNWTESQLTISAPTDEDADAR